MHAARTPHAPRSPSLEAPGAKRRERLFERLCMCIKPCFIHDGQCSCLCVRSELRSQRNAAAWLLTVWIIYRAVAAAIA